MRSAACPTPTTTGVLGPIAPLLIASLCIVAGAGPRSWGLQALQDLAGQLGGFRGSLADLDSSRFQGRFLRGGGTRGSGHNGTGVAHRLAFRRSESRDVADDRLGHVGLDVVRRT